MTIEIKINGRLIGHAYIVNQGSSTRQYMNKSVCRYDYEFYNVGHVLDHPKDSRGSVTKALLNGEVEHAREDGAAYLAKKVLEDVLRKKK